jgi:aminopeptidase YwaD
VPPLAAAAMMRHVRVLAERFPHRHLGEEDERLAIEYIASTLERLGLDVRVHAVPAMGWALTQAPELELLEPEPSALEAVPFIFSGSTRGDGCEGMLARIGPTSVVGIDPPWEKYAIVADGRPAALVVARPDGPAIAQSGPPEGFQSTADGPHYTWPACAIGTADGERIAAWLDGGAAVRARLRMRTEFRPGSLCHVVEATLAGGDDVIVVGAHHDCQGAAGFAPAWDSPGACDNASGVAALLELARHYAAAGHRSTLRFCSFGGEEWNLVGSRYYVRHLVETGQLPGVAAMLNLDQLANGERLYLVGSEELAAIGREELAALGLGERYETELRVPPTPGSDHWPFAGAGVPVLMLAWAPITGYHRSGDVVSACDRDDKYEAGVALARAVIDRAGRA